MTRRTPGSAGGYAVESFGDEFPDFQDECADLDDEIVLRLKRRDMERLCVFVDAYPSTLRGYQFARRIVGEINRVLKRDEQRAKERGRQ